MTVVPGHTESVTTESVTTEPITIRPMTTGPVTTGPSHHPAPISREQHHTMTTTSRTNTSRANTVRTTSSPLPVRRGPGAVARAAALMVAGVAAVGLTLVVAGPASASTLNGTATISSPGVTTPLTSGGSTTPFTVTLPAQAACDGDTATGGYHVYSYLLQQGVALSTVTFVSFPSTGFGLVDNTGTYYGPVNTAVTTGQIVGIPNNFQWAPLVTGGGVTLAQLLYTGSGSTASGVWETGLVCANTHGVVADNWNAQITFNASSTDPTGFTWTSVPTGSAAPAFTSAATATFTSGSPGSFTPTASGSPTPTIAETGTLPAGVTFTGGVLTGTPTATGTFPITFTATNGIGTAATQSFTLTVQAASVGTTTTTTTTASGSTSTSDPGATTTTTTASGVAATDSSGGDSSGSTGTGSGTSGTGSTSTLAFTGFHTIKGLGVGLLGIGLGLMLLGWGYRTRIRPARAARRSTE